MLLQDRLTLDRSSRSSDGYMKVRARSARAGVYDYLGQEVDPEGKKFAATDVVKVYRPADEVFKPESLASFVAKPITNDHPSVAVNANNWRQLAKGTVFGAVQDGEYIGFDLALMDADAIADVDAGKRELSNGYACDLSFEDGVAPDGTAYQAVQRNIRGNHVALVDRGRAGPECRIADAFAVCDANPEAVARLSATPTGDIPMKTLTIDGLRVPNVSDEAEAAITKLQDRVATAEKALADATSDHDKAMAAKDAEIDKLKEQVVDEATIDARAAEKADVLAKAKAVLGDKAPDFAGKPIADIRRMTVAAKIGDVAVKDKSDDYVEARFDGLTADDKTTHTAPSGSPVSFGDAATAWNDNVFKSAGVAVKQGA
jgi:hypothetical protein